MKKIFLATSLLSLFILGAASDARATPSGEKTTETAATSRGLWLEFKIGSSIGYAGNMVVLGTSPGFLMGYKLGRVTVGAEVSVGYSGSQSEGSSAGFEYRSVGFTVIPQVQVNLVQRGPFAVYLVGGAGVSLGWNSYPGMDDYESRSTGVLVHVGFGVRYYLHPRFALGLEVAADGRWFRTRTDFAGATERSVSWGATARGAFTAAVVF